MSCENVLLWLQKARKCNLSYFNINIRVNSCVAPLRPLLGCCLAGFYSRNKLALSQSGFAITPIANSDCNGVGTNE